MREEMRSCICEIDIERELPGKVQPYVWAIKIREATSQKWQSVVYLLEKKKNEENEQTKVHRR